MLIVSRKGMASNKPLVHVSLVPTTHFTFSSHVSDFLLLVLVSAVSL